MPRKRGGSLTAAETKDLIAASYQRKHEVQNVGGLQFDPSISTTRNKVFHDPATGKTVVANAGTTKASDWSHNLLWGVAPSLYTYTDRYKEQERVQKDAIKKYGAVNENVTHSQAGIGGREMNRRGLVQEHISVNPAAKGNEKQSKNEFVVKSQWDPVSMFNKAKQTVTVKTGSWNPFTNHSGNMLSHIAPQTVFGRGGRIMIHHYQ